ncbi:type IV secretory system conjugative DNA transfer family protein [Plantibacter sp. Mn2098]|uniref:type IV secretory system conjugative DNA transfer family protein n=1 Tax=Plantibacter sp. Mn2098 TaxID=3395266 RepID=UPI003BBE32DB
MSEPIVFARLYLPVPLDPAHVARLIARLSSPDAPRPAIFETRAGDHGVTHLIGSTIDRLGHLCRLVEDQLPGARTSSNASRTPVSGARRVHIEPRSLPLNPDATEAAVHALYAALGLRKPGEALVIQIALGRGHRPQIVPSIAADPTDSSIWHSLTRGNKPASSEIRTRLRRRAEQTTLDLNIAVGVVAETPDRRRALGHQVLGALQTLQAPGVRIELIRDSAQAINEPQRIRRFRLQLSPNELIPLLGWPVGGGELPGMPTLHPKRLPAPVSLSSTENCFAITTAPGDTRPVGIRPEARLQHLVVSGPTGSGKSMVFAHLILSDIKAGRPVVVVDPKRQLIDYVSDRIPADLTENVVVLDAADERPVGFNPLDTEGRNADVVVDGILSAFKAVFEDGWGPRTEDLLHAGLLSLAHAGVARGEPYTLLDLPRLLTDAPFRRTVSGAVASNPTLASFWAGYEELSPGARASIIAAPMNKLRKFVLRRNLAAVLGQSRSKLRLRDVFREGKTVLIPLNDALLGPGAAQLLGSLVVSELWMATLERASEPNPTSRPGSIYIDEVQQFLNLPTSIADALATSRSYGVSWNLAHQFRAQLPPAMRAAFDANARNKIVFGLGADDARDLARMATGRGLEAEDFMSLPTYEIYAQLVDQGGVTGWFSARTASPTPSLESGAHVRAASRERYGADSQPTDEPVDIRPSTAASGTSESGGGPEPPVGGHRRARRP